MKHLILVVLSIFLFLGCTQKQSTITTKEKQTKEEVAKINEEKYEIIGSQRNSEVDTLRENLGSLSQDDYDSQKIIINDITDEESKDFFRIAIIYPSQVIGKYANNTVNTVTGYLLFKNEKFEIETYDTVTEDKEAIETAFNTLKEKGYTNIIALFTANGYTSLNAISFDDEKIYLPLINKDYVNYESENYIFGGISYKKQIELLQTQSQTSNNMFYQKSYLGNKLKTIYENSVDKIKLIKSVDSRNNNYKRLVDDKRLNESSLMLNTSIIKTSIILSQLRAFETEPSVILSTQLNYNPLIVSLTQPEDRVKFLVANSIDDTDERLVDVISSLDANIVYDWVNYSSLIGVNLFFDENKSQLIKTKKVQNSIVYEPKLYNSTAFGFQKIK